MSRDGAWIELSWERPVELSHVQITFDSGFHRELTLSGSKGVLNRCVRGPQPETVKDYRIVVRTTSGDEVVTEVEGQLPALAPPRFRPADGERRASRSQRDAWRERSPRLRDPLLRMNSQGTP